MSAPAAAATEGVEPLLSAIAKRANDPGRDSPGFQFDLSWELVRYYDVNHTPRQWTQDMGRCIQSLVDHGLVDIGMRNLLYPFFSHFFRFPQMEHLIPPEIGVTQTALVDWVRRYSDVKGEYITHSARTPQEKDTEALQDLFVLASFQFGPTPDDAMRLYQAAVAVSPTLQRMEIHQGRLLLALIDLHVHVTIGKGGSSVAYLEQQIMRLATNTDAPKQLFLPIASYYNSLRLYVILAKYNVVDQIWSTGPSLPVQIQRVRPIAKWLNKEDDAHTLLRAIIGQVDGGTLLQSILVCMESGKWAYLCNAWVVNEVVHSWVNQGADFPDTEVNYRRMWNNIMIQAKKHDALFFTDGYQSNVFASERRRDVREMRQTFGLLVTHIPIDGYEGLAYIEDNKPPNVDNEYSFAGALMDAIHQYTHEQAAMKEHPPALVGMHKEFIKALMDTDTVDVLIPDLMAIIAAFRIGGEETKTDEEGRLIHQRTPFGRIVDKDTRTYFNEARGRRDQAAAESFMQQAALPVRRVMQGRARDETESDEDAMEESDEENDDEQVSKKSRTSGRVYVY